MPVGTDEVTGRRPVGLVWWPVARAGGPWSRGGWVVVGHAV
ncbi:hypothetical protein [Saccharothrix syringae]|nr:hypothetical protein [Saccharothrix syringae]